MPQFTLFGSGSDKNSTLGDVSQPTEPSQLITNKPEFHERIESESSTSSGSEEARNLEEDEDFIEIRRKHVVDAEASVKEFGGKPLEAIQGYLSKITNTQQREEKACRVLEELKGLEDTSIPGVADANAVYDAVFKTIANDGYVSNKSLVSYIESGLGARFPSKALVLPTIFSNFPNILTDEKLKEEEQSRSLSTSPWNF